MREKMSNLSENEINQLENYAAMQILYINDYARNNCILLGEDLKKQNYRSKAVKTIYGALMKRWSRYQNIIDSFTIDMQSISNLFCEIDDYMDDRIINVKKALEEVFVRNGLEAANWVAKVETAEILCNYAASSASHIIQKVVCYSKRFAVMTPLIINEQCRVMKAMADIVAEIHVGTKINIDLNKEEKLQVAMRQLNKAFLDPKNFSKAQEKADKINIEENRMTIM